MGFGEMWEILNSSQKALSHMEGTREGWTDGFSVSLPANIREVSCQTLEVGTTVSI